MYECIVCDPDNGSYEGKASGLFYTALSRATTLGDPRGLHSAIYFTGASFNKDRITKIGEYAPPNSGKMKNFVKREKWVEHIARNTRPNTLTGSEMKDITAWCKKRKVTYDQLYSRTKEYVTKMLNPS